MAEKGRVDLRSLKELVKKGAASVDIEAARETALNASRIIGDRALEIKDSAMAMKAEITEKINELDRMLEGAITEYNDAYTVMNDKGVQLFMERSRAVDSIQFVENLINSIANRPKSFDTEFEDIRVNRDKFRDNCDFSEHELKAAREAAGGAGAGIAGGAAVAFMAPTAAMWVATTFGTASTGAAISTLSAAAATNAALAWLGGGALSAGGGGIVAGNALLAMAGPVGWTVAGATLLTSILLFSKNRAKINKEKNEEIKAVKENTEKIREMDAQISQILKETKGVRNGLNEMFFQCAPAYGEDYTGFSDLQKKQLGALVNHTKTLSALLDKTVN